LKDPKDFTKHGLMICDVLDHLCNQDCAEAMILEGQFRGRANDINARFARLNNIAAHVSGNTTIEHFLERFIAAPYIQ
jgi:hypothetical protein